MLGGGEHDADFARGGRADRRFAGRGFEHSAANVAEYYDIPLATLALLPDTGQRPAPAVPAGAVGLRGVDGVRLAVCGRAGRSKTRSAVNSVCRRRHAPGCAGSRTADRWKSRPMMSAAFPGWPPNGRTGMAPAALCWRADDGVADGCR